MLSIKLVGYASSGTGANGKLSLAAVEGEPERLGKAFLILHCIVLAQRELHCLDAVTLLNLGLKEVTLGSPQ